MNEKRLAKIILLTILSAILFGNLCRVLKSFGSQSQSIVIGTLIGVTLGAVIGIVLTKRVQQ